MYLRNKDNYYRWKTSAVDTFNEVYYQCTRVVNDKNPEEEIYCNYLNDAKADIGTRYGSDFVFCIVYAVLSARHGNKDNVDFFLSELATYIDGSCYFQPLNDFAKTYREKYGPVDIDLAINPTPASDLTEFDYSAWKEATMDFDQVIIKRIVMRYKSLKDRLAIIDLIERQQNTPPEYSNPLDDLPF